MLPAVSVRRARTDLRAEKGPDATLSKRWRNRLEKGGGYKGGMGLTFDHFIAAAVAGAIVLVTLANSDVFLDLGRLFAG